MIRTSSYMIAFTYFVLLSSPTISYCADINYIYHFIETEDDIITKQQLTISGDIVTGDFNKLLALVSEDLNQYINDISIINVSSNGGDLIEAIKIGEFIKRTYKTIYVDSICASSCFFIYISAVDRRLADYGKLGVHRPYFSRFYFSNLKPDKAEKKQRDMMYMVRKYLNDNGVPQGLIDKMYTLSSSEIYWLDRKDVYSIGDKAIWYEEYLTAKCGYKKVPDKIYYEDGNTVYDLGVLDYDLCAEKFTRTEATKYLKTLIGNRIKKTKNR